MSPAAQRLLKALQRATASTAHRPMPLMHLPYGRYLVASVRVNRRTVDELEAAGYAIAERYVRQPTIRLTPAGREAP